MRRSVSVVMVVGTVMSVGALALLDRGTDTERHPQASVSALTGGSAGLPVASGLPRDLRPLPRNAWLQYSYAGGHGVPQQPEIPQIQLRLYADGTLLTATGRDRDSRWKQTQLSATERVRVRELVAEAGLAAGRRDYGLPTNAGFGGIAVVLQVRTDQGEVPSLVELGGTVNGVPSSDEGLTAAQRGARGRIKELMALLEGGARRGGATYRPSRWSRYAKPSPGSAPVDVAVYPVWAGSRLDAGRDRVDGLRCVAVRDPKRDAGRRYADSSYRFGGAAWVVRYDEVLPGEDPCSAVAATGRA